MQDARPKSCRPVWKCEVYEKMNEPIPQFCPCSAMTDFEKASVSAYHCVFDDATLNGCWFQWQTVKAQAIEWLLCRTDEPMVTVAVGNYHDSDCSTVSSDIDCSEPSKRSWSNYRYQEDETRKAPGICGIQVKLMKAGSPDFVTAVFKPAWQTREFMGVTMAPQTHNAGSVKGPLALWEKL